MWNSYDQNILIGEQAYTKTTSLFTWAVQLSFLRPNFLIDKTGIITQCCAHCYLGCFTMDINCYNNDGDDCNYDVNDEECSW